MTCGAVRVVHIFQLHVFMFLAPYCDVPYVLKLSSLKKIVLFFVFCFLFVRFLFFVVFCCYFVCLFVLFCFCFGFFVVFLLFFLVFVFALFLFLFVCFFSLVSCFFNFFNFCVCFCLSLLLHYFTVYIHVCHGSCLRSIL